MEVGFNRAERVAMVAMVPLFADNVALKPAREDKEPVRRGMRTNASFTRFLTVFTRFLNATVKGNLTFQKTFGRQSFWAFLNLLLLNNASLTRFLTGFFLNPTVELDVCCHSKT